MKSLKAIRKQRLEFLRQNKNNDHAIILGSNKVLLSSPHGVFQVRNGKRKVCEPGSLSTALFLQKLNDCFLIAKTKNNNDDANFDEVSSYKDEIKNFIEKYNIKYVIDFHGLSKKREMDINLGTDNYNNTRLNNKALKNLSAKLRANNFKVEIDNPFRGGGKTISGFVQTLNKNVFSLQIEINCGITNDYKNFKRYLCLLKILSLWIEKLN